MRARLGRAAGIIPARAGFTRGGDVRLRARSDHPRSRGVYPRAAPSAAPPSGSSPLARGLLISDPLGAVENRIIPARAGFTRPLHAGARRRPDHPRSRGVYGSFGLPACEPVGSSPLARGLHLPCHADVLLERIIPARAGFTRTSKWNGESSSDHPRSRGVYSRCPPSRGTPPGSSPLARGLHDGKTNYMHFRGIIPARAGFTQHHRLRPPPRRDHPRSRGVYRRTRVTCRRDTGSSPLARGLPRPPRAARPPRRIIPARAGFTNPEDYTPGPWTDHPRSRGVYHHRQ